jgi:hypothetical protein
MGGGACTASWTRSDGIPLGFAVLDEPRRPFAVVVEGLAGIVLALGAFAVFSRKTWAWVVVTGAHAVALAGVLWGMVAIAAGRGPHTCSTTPIIV